MTAFLTLILCQAHTLITKWRNCHIYCKCLF